MAGQIYRYLADDHSRLDEALQRATEPAGMIEPLAYAEFRGGLLRHIGMEEKILLPAAESARNGEPLAIAPKLHLDHGALAALLVPTPTKSIIATIRRILIDHNALEEGPDGVYEQCEQLASLEADNLLLRLRNAPAVKMSAHVDNLIAMDSLRMALHRAGYTLEP